ncbi:MAG: hypothetical protein K5885_08035 [Bacteroidales bacterium]|nr:hypothetical protein [Bacteroidales bacterium]
MSYSNLIPRLSSFLVQRKNIKFNEISNPFLLCVENYFEPHHTGFL